MNKKMILFLMMVGMTFSGFAQLNPADLQSEIKSTAFAKLVMTDLSHDFGDIAKGIPVSHTFEFVNEGDAPLIVSQVKTTCGCTASEFTREPVMPGMTGTVKATYNAAKIGTFNKTVTIVSNSGEQALKIRGVVLE